MVEVLRDRAGQAWFMELNGRTWGSMALARHRGLGYPSWAVRAALDPEFSPPYPGMAGVTAPNVTARHLGREIVHLGMVLARGDAPRIPTVRDVLIPHRGDRWYNWRPGEPAVFAADTWNTVRSQLEARPESMSEVQPEPAGRGQAVKAVAHVHSEWSDDATWPLSRIATTFSRRGCHVVLMSEHSRGFTAAKWDDYRQACADASTDRVRLVPGIEYGDEDNVVHIPVWGDVPFFGDPPDIGDLLKQATAAGEPRRVGASVAAGSLAAVRAVLVGIPRGGRGLGPEIRRHRAQPRFARAGPPARGGPVRGARSAYPASAVPAIAEPVGPGHLRPPRGA